MSAGSVLTIRAAVKGRVPKTLDDRIQRPNGHQLVNALVRILSELPQNGGQVSASVDAVGDGDTVGEDVSLTATCTQASILADDTVVIGGTTLTWKASASGEDQVDIGASDTEAGANLAAKINAHSDLQGVVEASAASGVVTVTMRNVGRLGQHVVLSETGTGVVLSATSFATTATLTAQSSTVVSKTI